MGSASTVRSVAPWHAWRPSSGADIDDGNLGRRPEADGGAPGARPPADVDGHPLGGDIIAPVIREQEGSEEGEGEDLAAVGVTGQLEVEGLRGAPNGDRAVFQKDSKGPVGGLFQ